jgi:hypothetical protein
MLGCETKVDSTGSINGIFYKIRDKKKKKNNSKS